MFVFVIYILLLKKDVNVAFGLWVNIILDWVARLGQAKVPSHSFSRNAVSLGKQA